MSSWTHSICERCWRRREGKRRPVATDKWAPLESCCFCDQKHQSGIYVRHDPTSDQLKCGGEHEV
jgi:hypothetical protein